MAQMPFAKVQARRERAEREGWWVEPPFGLLNDADMTMMVWLDVCSVGRAQSLIENFHEGQKQLTPDQQRERAYKARHDLYG